MSIFKSLMVIALSRAWVVNGISGKFDQAGRASQTPGKVLCNLPFLHIILKLSHTLDIMEV